MGHNPFWPLFGRPKKKKSYCCGGFISDAESERLCKEHEKDLREYKKKLNSALDLREEARFLRGFNKPCEPVKREEEV